MARKKVTAYSGGWDPNTRDRVNAVSLPEKVRCIRCKKFKTPENYSKTQLAELRHIIFKGQQTTEGIRCRVCTGSQVTELQCSECDKWKGLDEFAKAQRGKADKAKCLECMNKQLNMEPENSDPEGSSDNDSYGEIDSIAAGCNIADSEADDLEFNQLSLAETSSANGSTSASQSSAGKSLSTDAYTLDKDGFIVQPRGTSLNTDACTLNKDGFSVQPRGTSLNTDAYTLTNDGFIVQPRGKRVYVPSASADSRTATSSNWGSFDPHAYGRQKKSVVSENRGWAKPPKTPTKNNMFDVDDNEEEAEQEQQEGESNWPSDGEDDDDEDDEYGKI